MIEGDSIYPMVFFSLVFSHGFSKGFSMGCFLKSLSPTEQYRWANTIRPTATKSVQPGQDHPSRTFFHLKSSDTFTPSWHFLKLQQPLFWGEHTMNPKHIFEPTHTRDHHLCHLKVSNFKFFFGSASALSQEENRLWTGGSVRKCLVPSSHMTHVSIPEFRNCHKNSAWDKGLVLRTKV